MGQEMTAKTMRIVHECRPYELGWLLYVFAAANPRLRSRELAVTSM
jgi:hypothetical protein